MRNQIKIFHLVPKHGGKARFKCIFWIGLLISAVTLVYYDYSITRCAESLDRVLPAGNNPNLSQCNAEITKLATS